MFLLSLLEFYITVLPFEPKGSQKVEDEPHIHESVWKLSPLICGFIRITLHMFGLYDEYLCKIHE